MAFLSRVFSIAVRASLLSFSLLSIYLLYPHSCDYSLFADVDPALERLDTTVERYFLTVNNVKLHITEAGSKKGKLLLFVHGFPQMGDLAWKNQIPHFADLGYHVIAPDLRGYGRSEIPRNELMTVPEIVEDLKAIIKHYGNGQKAYVVAHDWGAAPSWVLGTISPDLVEKLVILNLPHQKALIMAFKSSLQLLKSWYAFFFQIPVVSEWKIARNDFAWLTTGLGSSSFNQSFSKPEIARYHASWGEQGRLTSMLSLYRNVAATREQSRQWSEVHGDKTKVDTLLLWGEHDRALDVKGAYLSEQFMGSGRLELLNATHWIQHDAPRDVNKMIEEWIK